MEEKVEAKVEEKFEEKYHVFSCDDGEVLSYTNLDKNSAVNEIYCDWIEDTHLTPEQILNTPDDELEDILLLWEEERESEEYGDGLTGLIEVYKSTPSGDLKMVSFTPQDVKDWVRDEIMD